MHKLFLLIFFFISKCVFADGIIIPPQVFRTDNLSVFSATTSAQLAGVLSNETGSGLAVFGTSPTLSTTQQFHEATNSNFYFSDRSGIPEILSLDDALSLVSPLRIVGSTITLLNNVGNTIAVIDSTGVAVTGTINATTAVQKNGVSILPSLSGTTGSIGGGALTAGSCASGTVAVTSSTTSMTVGVSPNTYPGDGTVWYGYVSANGTVTVKVCAILAITPTSSTYNVRVIQ